MEKVEITVSISKENYDSIKKFSEITGLSMDVAIDRSISSKIPNSSGIEWAEFRIADAFATATLNLSEKDIKHLLENLINVFEILKKTNVFADNKKNYFDIINKYFRISDVLSYPK